MAVGQNIENMRRLAEEGDPAAQYNLGVMYANGEGVPTNYIRAYAWRNIAAASRHEDAIGNRSIVEQQITSA